MKNNYIKPLKINSLLLSTSEIPAFFGDFLNGLTFVDPVKNPLFICDNFFSAHQYVSQSVASLSLVVSQIMALGAISFVNLLWFA